MATIPDLSFLAKKYYYLARLYYVGTEKVMNNFSLAMDYFRRSAECGNEMGRFQLGLMYYFGTGEVVPSDSKKGVELFFQAYQGGNQYGALFLGRCFQSGSGIRKDEKAAVKIYTELAEAGFSDGQVHLGKCYFHGVGVEQDYGKAMELYRRAADQGNTAAMLYLYQSYRNGQGVEKDEKIAEEWLKKYFEHIPSDEDDEPVFWYEVNPEEYAEAMELFHKGADMGDADCQYVLGMFYLLGDGVVTSLSKARILLSKAAEQGHKKAKELIKEHF